MEADQVISHTKSWVDQFVIGLNLCPFAKNPQKNGRIKYQLLNEKQGSVLLNRLLDIAKELAESTEGKELTYIAITPKVLEHFLDYWDFCALLEEAMYEQGLEGIIQLATFHPKYQFAGTKEDAPQNYTNRSPYPLFHFLREKDLEQALENYPNPEQIPIRNIEKMQAMGLAEIHALHQKMKPHL